MKIFSTRSIEIKKSIATIDRQYIRFIGELVSYSYEQISERADLNEYLRNKLKSKKSIATLTFYCLEKDKKEESKNEYGCLKIPGSFSFTKLTEEFTLSCECAVTEIMWNKIKDDVHIKNDAMFAFNVSTINVSKLNESTDFIDANCELLVDSYSLIYNFTKL